MALLATANKAAHVRRLGIEMFTLLIQRGIDVEEALAIVKRGMRDKDDTVRHGAMSLAEVLIAQGIHTEEVLSVLQAADKDNNAEVGQVGSKSWRHYLYRLW